MGDLTSAGKTIKEQARDITVCREADVIVVGGGPGGIGAALAAARNGMDTVLIERYGHLGGMGTGGLVTIIPNLSDVNGKQQIAGITQEWLSGLEKWEALDYPKKEHWGTADRDIVKYYADRSFFYTRLNTVVYSAHIDAELSKYLLNTMVEKAGVKTYLHSWGTEPIMDGEAVKGVIFESKSGRQAVLGKVVIDSTGDGDLLPFTQAEFETNIPSGFRIENLAMCFWIANVNLEKLDAFRKEHPDRFAEQAQELMKTGGLPGYIPSRLKDQESVVWIHTRYPNRSQVDVEELTRVEFEGREKMMTTWEYRKKNTPGFENSFIVLSSPQLGTRASRRVIGDYYLTKKDLDTNEPFEDTIAIFPDVDRGESSIKYPLTYIPYRALIPRKTENLLVACRAFSSDPMVQEFFNLIPHCIAFGQAAGTAAALAIKDGAGLRAVNYATLQENLAAQGVPLPGPYAALSKA
ncbi:MAG: FAD-dependent oxidoreductase [Dehalococcoidales bacterium]|nr:FAD-dependent oxidoreductase [Dehalococcoidales bacterium]